MNEPVGLFGIDVLNCTSFDFLDGSMQYNDVNFLIDSLKKYDGTYVQVCTDWKIIVWNEEGKVIDQFFLIENDEFKNLLLKKYPVIDM